MVTAEHVHLIRYRKRVFPNASSRPPMTADVCIAYGSLPGFDGRSLLRPDAVIGDELVRMMKSSNAARQCLSEPELTLPGMVDDRVISD